MILSPHDASRIRNTALSALHWIAAETGCEVSDILALIKSNARHEADIAGEAELRAADPASHSHADAEGSRSTRGTDVGIGGGAENAPDPAQAGETRNPPAPIPVQDTLVPPPSGGPDASDAASSDEAGEAMAPPKVASPAPSRRGPYKSKHHTLNMRVKAAHEAHPDFTSRQLAEHMGENVRRVQDAIARIRLPVRRPNTQEMSAILSASKGITTKQQILDLVATEPALSRQQVADRFGVKHQYVLRVCRVAGVSCPPLADDASQPGRAFARFPYAGQDDGDDAPAEVVEAIIPPRARVDTERPAPARPEARQSVLRQSSEPMPPRQPSASILARVRKRHEQKPNWTAGMLAKELGLPHDMAQAALDQIKAVAADDQPKMAGW